MTEYTKTCASDNDVDATQNGECEKTNAIIGNRIYKRRWMILVLFVFYCCFNLFQWVQYSIIADVIVRYYETSYIAADWSALIYLVLYIPFSFPGSYLLDKLGLRNAVLMGMFGTCIGAWIKVASVAPDRYWVVLVGQSFVAIADVFILPVPPRLAAVWFGPNEVSTACSIGVFGNQLGIATGFLLPPMLVNSRMEKEVIESKLFMMALAVAIVCSIFLLILCLCFQAAPPTPPSTTQLNESKSTSFTASVKKIMRNQSYVLLLVAFGINLGISYVISILLNEIILKHHPDAAADAGVIGLIMIIFGMIGCIVGGIILDKFKRFRETSISFYALSFVAIVVFTLVIDKNIEFIYIVSAIIGFSMAGVLTTGLEVGVELTYPEPEGTSGGLLTTGAQIFGLIFTYLYSYLFHKFNEIWATLTMAAFLLIGTFLLACLRFDLRRQRSQRIVELCT